jgi:hypothetical protein
MLQPIRKPKSVRNPDGTFKTLDQLLRQSLTVLQYGRLLAAKGR